MTGKSAWIKEGSGHRVKGEIFWGYAKDPKFQELRPLPVLTTGSD